MKKIFFGLFGVVYFSIFLISSEFALNVNIHYSAGNSSFFDNNSNLFWDGGYNYSEKSKNKMGMGFSLNLVIPVVKRLSMVPGVSVDFGNQNYEFKRVEAESDSDVKQNFYFHLIRSDLKLNYDFLVLKNGWSLSAIVGMGYSVLSSDAEINTGNDKFWNVITGLGVKFFQLKHLGFYFSSIYNYPLKNRNFEYLTFQSGIIYRF